MVNKVKCGRREGDAGQILWGLTDTMGRLWWVLWGCSTLSDLYFGKLILANVEMRLQENEASRQQAGSSCNNPGK